MKQYKIKDFYDYCISKGYTSFSYKKDREVIDLRNANFYTKTFFNSSNKINAILRHKTSKDLIKLTAFNENKNVKKTVIVTTDHVCMIYNSNNFFENLESKYVKLGDVVCIFHENEEIRGYITNIENLGKTDDFVYDLEVDKIHSFYADDILIHNSLFINIACITDDFKKKFNLPIKLNDWSDDYKLKLWNYVENFASKITNNVQKQLQEECFTENASMVNYELEYIGDVGVYQAKKNYGVHKILGEGPVIIDEVKYTGLEMRKATLPDAIKSTLEDVYTNTFAQNWEESDFHAYLNSAYEKFKELNIQEIAQWKGYGTVRASTGFLQMEKGSTIIARASEYYNQLIKKMKLGRYYDEIKLNDKVRFVYLVPTNIYGINCIAFHDNAWPKEFDKLFQIDYSTMFDKCVLSPLKNFMVAAKYSSIKPGHNLAFDIFNI